MNLRKIFGKQITEQHVKKYSVFFYEDLGNNQLKVEMISIWKLGSLLETHSYNKEQPYGLPLFTKKPENDLPK